MSTDKPIRQSALKYLAKSPAHYRDYLEHGMEATPAMLLGTAVHRLVLGGPTVHWFDGERRGKAWQEFRANLPGELILNAREYDTARAIADRVKEEAADTLEGCAFETQIEWSFFGRRCQSTIDAFKPGVVIELKVSKTADPRYFWPHMAVQHWEAQLAFYERALASSSDVNCAEAPPRELVIIAVEPKRPYACTVFHLPEEARKQGRKKIHAWMELLLQCERDDYWPAYADKPVKLAAPEWVADELEEDEEEVG